MASRYGHAWVSQYGPQPDGIAGAEWRSTLAGMDKEDIDWGFREDRARGAEWPPSSSAFRAMCLGVPSLAAVLDEVNDRLKYDPKEPPTPFVRYMWRYVDAYRLKQADYKAADRLIKNAYELAKADVMDGVQLPEPAAGTIDAPKDPKPVPASPETAMRHIDEIKRMLGGASEPEAE